MAHLKSPNSKNSISNDLAAPHIQNTKAPNRGLPNYPVDFPRFISHEMKEAVMDRDGKKCVRCGAEEYLEMDHAVPVSMGGTASENNLQVLCRKCNSIKRNRQWWGPTLYSEGLKKCGSEDNIKLLMKRSGLKDF